MVSHALDEGSSACPQAAILGPGCSLFILPLCLTGGSWPPVIGLHMDNVHHGWVGMEVAPLAVVAGDGKKHNELEQNHLLLFAPEPLISSIFTINIRRPLSGSMLCWPVFFPPPHTSPGMEARV